MSTYVIATNADLTAILQEKLPVLTLADPIFTDIMPIENEDNFIVMWEQRDNYTGLMAVRGLEGQPGRVQRVGTKQYQMQPGTYGDFIPLTETDLTMGREIGTFGTPINVEKQIARDQDFLLGRAVDRLRKIGWDLALNGVFSVPGPNGQILHTDSFTLQSFTAGVAWSTTATATPLADLRNMKLKARGKGVKFGRSAKLYVNSGTVNNILNNTNANDIGGRRTTTQNGVIQPLSKKDLNSILADQDLPEIVEYDEGYLDDTGTFQLFIPNNQGVLVGARITGEAPAAFKMTRNPNNEGAGPGMYNKVRYRRDEVPVSIETHMGFNGGPAVYFGSAFVKVSF